MIVHDVATQLTDGLQAELPDLPCHFHAARLSAASHDLVKVLRPQELTDPGRRHEIEGAPLLENHGVPPELARFARKHSAGSENSTLEELLVSTSDKIWKGQRVDDLESLLARRLAQQAGEEEWQVFSVLDGLLTRIALNADARLALQR